MSRRVAKPCVGAPSQSRWRLSARAVVIATPVRTSTGSGSTVSPVLVTIYKWAKKADGIFPTAAADVPV